MDPPTHAQAGIRSIAVPKGRTQATATDCQMSTRLTNCSSGFWKKEGSWASFTTFKKRVDSLNYGTLVGRR